MYRSQWLPLLLPNSSVLGWGMGSPWVCRGQVEMLPWCPYLLILGEAASYPYRHLQPGQAIAHKTSTVVTREKLLQGGEIACLIAGGSAKCGSLNKMGVRLGLKGVWGGSIGSVHSGVCGRSLALDVEHRETGSCIRLSPRSCCSDFQEMLWVHQEL